MQILEEMHKGEKILKLLKPSRWAYFGWYFLSVFLIIIGLVFGLEGFIFIILFIGAPIIVITELVRNGNTYFITNKRIIRQFIFLAKKVSSTSYDKIQDLHLTQGIIERIVGIGTLHINTAGTHFIEIEFHGLINPVSIKRLVEEQSMKKKR